MSRYRAFAPGLVLLYGGIVVACTAGTIAAWITGPAALRQIATIALAAAVFAFVMEFRKRLAHQRSIAGYTSQGVALLPGVCGSRWTPAVTAAIDQEIAEALTFWWSRYPAQTAEMERALDSTVMYFTDQLLVGPQNQLCVGLTSVTSVGIWWPVTETIDPVLPRVRHEIGHVLLGAVGIWENDASHLVMAREGYGA